MEMAPFGLGGNSDVIVENSAPHDAVRDVLSHLVVQNDVTDAAVVETRFAAASSRKNLRC